MQVGATNEPLSPSQNAMRAARGESRARDLGVSRNFMRFARRVLSQGTPQLIASVDDGRIAVSTAAAVANMPKDQQDVEVARIKGRPSGRKKKPRTPIKENVAVNKLSVIIEIIRDLKRNADKPTLLVSVLDLRVGIDRSLVELESLISCKELSC